MARTPSPLALSRSQILAYRRRACCLDERLPAGASSLRRAAWAGLQDSMPRAALLSIHARVEGTAPTTSQHKSLVQLWGPRFNDYVVAAADLAVFSLGRLPDDARRRARAFETARRLQEALDGRRLPYGELGREMGVPPNSLRYAAPTGMVQLKWDGARQPVIWSVAAPEMHATHARLELARRCLRVFGPSTPASFAKWAGVGSGEANRAFTALADELIPVRTPVGDAWILAEDEDAFRAADGPAARARLLPSGDAYFLLWDRGRAILVPDAKRQAQLWTTRVWPGALMVNGEIVGVWRRAAGNISIELWRRLSVPEWADVEAEAMSLPLSIALTVQRSMV